MEYEVLAAERAAIRLPIDLLVTLAQQDVPQPEAASGVLKRLATLVRDHLAHAEPIIRAAGAAAHGGRHQKTADTALAALTATKDEWSRYLYRWNPDAVVENWPQFAQETLGFFDNFDERVGTEFSILYALALYHGLLTLRPGSFFEPRLRD